MIPIPKNAIPSDTAFSFSAAARFWERRRLVYNLVLTVTLLFWLLLSWRHFRPALTLSSLPPLIGLAFLANLCYSAAYFADLAIQHLLSNHLWSRTRWTLFLLGTLFAMLVESYWINDEIYPAITQATTIFLRKVMLC